MLAFIQFAPCICLPFGGILIILTFAFWIWMLIEIISKEPSEGNEKIIWLIVVILLHGLGALLYFLIRRPERIRKYGS